MRRVIVPFLVASAVLLGAQAARADQVFFFTQNITNNTADPGTQYTMRVLGPTDGALGQFGGPIASNQVEFVFQMTAPAGAFSPFASIAETYFQDGTLLGIASIRNSATTTFSAPATPANPPGGNSINPPFHTTDQFSAGGATNNGDVFPGQYVGIVFDLKTNPVTMLPYTYNDVIAALLEGINNPSAVWDSSGNDIPGAPLGLRAAIHVHDTGANGNQSDAFILGPGGGGGGTSLTPLPPSFLMAGLGALGLLGGRFIRRKTSA
jgi:hypothetical protein